MRSIVPAWARSLSGPAAICLRVQEDHASCANQNAPGAQLNIAIAKMEMTTTNGSTEAAVLYLIAPLC